MDVGTGSGSDAIQRPNGIEAISADDIWAVGRGASGPQRRLPDSDLNTGTARTGP